MIWRDILIDRRPNDAELRQSLAQVFQIDPTKVGLFGDYRELLQPMPDTIRLLCERLPVSGEFIMKLGVMPVHPVQEAFTRGSNDLTLLSALCRILATRGLIDDGSHNPYAFLLLGPDGSVSNAALDAQRLDMDDEYVLSLDGAFAENNAPC